MRDRSHVLLVIMAAVVGTGVTNSDEIHEVVLTGRIHQVVADNLVDGIHRVLKSETHEASDTMGDLRDKKRHKVTSSNGEKYWLTLLETSSGFTFEVLTQITMSWSPLLRSIILVMKLRALMDCSEPSEQTATRNFWSLFFDLIPF